MIDAARLTVVILTYNEEIHIERAIRSVLGLAHEIIVVDSYSTDRTCDVASGLGARVVQRAFVSQADQMQWALEHTGIGSGWVMRLDADEVIGADLANSLRRTIQEAPADVTGLMLNRRHIFMDRWIRHGGRYPLLLLRVWRTGAARVEQRLMDEHALLISGRAIVVEGEFADHNLRDLSFFTAKHNAYATREAVETISRRLGHVRPEDDVLGAPSRQIRAKRMMKRLVFDRLGLLGAPLGYFLYRYLIQLGFLDGREGLIYHLLQGFWYRFLVAAKTYELERAIGPTHSTEDMSREIERLTGFTT